jgi:hypothetical protein
MNVKAAYDVGHDAGYAGILPDVYPDVPHPSGREKDEYWLGWREGNAARQQEKLEDGKVFDTPVHKFKVPEE